MVRGLQKIFWPKFFWSGGIHARARVFVKTLPPTAIWGVPNPQNLSWTSRLRPVYSQNTSMMCSCIPRTIQEDPRIPTSPNKTSKYLFKPKISSVRYFHMDIASLIGSWGLFRPKIAKYGPKSKFSNFTYLTYSFSDFPSSSSSRGSVLKPH